MKKIAAAVLGLGLCTALAAGGSLTAFAGEPFSGYDYSDPRFPASATVNAAQLLDGYLGEGVIGQAERAYLEADGAFLLSYRDAVGATNVDVLFDGGSLSVTARPLVYTAANGAQVVWTPVFANGESVTERDGDFVWGKSGVTEADGDFVSVEYETSFPVRAETLSPLFNRAYYASFEAEQRIADEAERYKEDCAQYEEDLVRYDRYLAQKAEYERDLENYENYREKYDAWNARNQAYLGYLDEYNRYVAECEQYKADYAAYERKRAQYDADLRKYADYQAELADYRKKYEAYLDSFSSEELQTVRRQIGYLDFIMQQPTVEQDGKTQRSIYTAVMGSLVTQVLENKDVIAEQVRGTGKVLDYAEAATLILREDLLPRLRACYTDEEKYIFYLNNYKELTAQFTKLFQALDYLYNNFRTIHKEISSRYPWQFRTLTAQLYVLCEALQDGPVPDYRNAAGVGVGSYFADDYTVDDYTPAQIIGEYPEDEEGGAPLPNGLPQLPKEPVEPTEVKHPGAAPTPPAAPIAPEEVGEPGPAPDEVKEPVPPQEMEEPQQPQPYVPQAWEEPLIEARKSGALTLRDEEAEDFTLTVRTTVVRYFRNAQITLIYFYGKEYTGEAQEAVCTVEADRNSRVVYPMEFPQKTKEGYECTFDCWVDASGEEVSLDPFESDASTLQLYPRFREEAKCYSIVWEVNGERFEDVCAYDSVPVYDEARFASLSLPPERDGRVYRFNGWMLGDVFYKEGALAPMQRTGDACYVAVFEKSLLVTWVVDGYSETRPGWKGEIPDYGAVPYREATRLRWYRFAGWSENGTDAAPLGPLQGDARFVAVFEEAFLVGSADGKAASVTLEDGFYTADCLTMNVRPYDAEGLFLLAARKGLGAGFVLSDGTLTFPAETAAELAESGAVGFDFSFLIYSERHIRLSARFTDGEGNEIVPAGTFRFERTVSFSMSDLYLYRNGEGDALRYEYEAGSKTLVFTRMEAGGYYELLAQYAVTTVSSDATYTVSRTLAGEGDVVSLRVEELPKGKYVSSFFLDYSYPGEDGVPVPVHTVIEVSADGLTGSFEMPAYPVSVGLSLLDCEYRVRFISGGQTLLTVTVKYGEKVDVPESLTAQKASDDEFSYEFIGWEGDVTAPIEGDTDFVAKFRAVPLPERTPTPHSKYYYLLMAAKIGGPIALVLIVGLIVLVVTLRIRKKRKRAARAQDAAQRENSPKEGNSGGKNGE